MSKFTPKVSIIIPVYNGSNYMRDAIDSALNQSYKNIEVIVVNDGSTDNGATDKIALSYGNKIKYYKKENGGVGTALNLAIEKMTGEYFSWLSHDDLYTRNKVKAQVKVLQKLEDKKTVIVCGYTVVNERKEYIWEINPYENYTEEQLDTPLFGLFKGLANGCCILIHKSHFDRVGTFDVSLKTTNDYDLWFRIMRDAPIKYHKGLYVKSRYHQGQDSKTVTGYTEECNKLWINMMNSLTKEEIENIDHNSYLFYKNTYKFLKNGSNYYRAIIYAYYKMLEQLKIRVKTAKYTGPILKKSDFHKRLTKLILYKPENPDIPVNKNVIDKIRYSLGQRGFIQTIKLVVKRIYEKIRFNHTLYNNSSTENIAFDYTLQPGRNLDESNICTSPIEKADISIITAFYNDYKYIMQTAASVINQTFKHFEWVIIDDGSNDEKSLAKLKEIEKLDSRIRILHKQNEGLAVARDYGVKNSDVNSEYLFILDSDDLIENTYLECAYWTLEANKNAAWAYADLANFGEQKLLWIKPFDLEQEKKNNLLVCTALIRKDDFLSVDGYNLHEKGIYEDWNLWLKLLAKGKYPVRMNFIGFWYRVKEHSQSELYRANSNRKESMKYINKTKKRIKNSITAMQYSNIEHNCTPSYIEQILKGCNKKRNIILIKNIEELDINKLVECNKDTILISLVNINYSLRQQISKRINIIYDLTTFISTEYWLDFVKSIVEGEV